MSLGDVAERSSPEAAGTAPIVAGPGRYYRNARYVFGALMIGMGAYFAYDGWAGYPDHNARYRAADAALRDAESRQDADAIRRHQAERNALGKTHTDSDIALQKRLGVALPIIGVGMVAWMRYRSRGEYRLTDDALHVPGHPPIPLDAIRAIDLAQWERKGIARVEHAGGRVTLDDFVYARDPTDEIVNRLCARVGTPYPAPPSRE